MTSSSEQDNLEFLLEEETDNNCSNTQDDAQRCTSGPFARSAASYSK